MKCEHCGFISAKDYYKCPYCGAIQDVESNVLDSDIKIGSLFSIRLRTLIIMVLANILLVALFIDVATEFRYWFCYWVFILLGGSYLVASVITAKSPLIVAAEKLDVFILIVLCLGTAAFKIDGAFDFTRMMPTLVIPMFTIIGSLFSFTLLFIKRKKKFRPLWTEVLLFAHLAVMLTIFILYLVAKGQAPGEALREYFILQGSLGVFQQVIIYLALAFSVVYIVNYNIVIFGHIIKEVKIRYGGERRD